MVSNASRRRRGTPRKSASKAGSAAGNETPFDKSASFNNESSLFGQGDVESSVQTPVELSAILEEEESELSIEDELETAQDRARRVALEVAAREQRVEYGPRTSAYKSMSEWLSNKYDR